MNANDNHSLMKRQLKRYFQAEENLTKEIKDFVEAVSDAYYQFERDYNLLERSMQLSSQELIQAVNERKLAEEKIRRHNERLSALQNSTVALMNTLDSPKISQKILQGAIDIVEAAGGFILLWNRKKQHFSIKARAGIQIKMSGAWPAANSGFVHKVIKEGRILIIKDYRCYQERLPILFPDNVTTIIGVPIKVRDVQGVIGLTYLDTARNIETDMVEIINQYVTAAAIALDNFRLYRVARAELLERSRVEAKLRFHSAHDKLTGLYNRNYFEAEIERLNVQGCKDIGVVICDIDGLKLINDTLGHASGDTMLSSAAKIISNIFGNYGTVARIGGDEFAVLLPNFDKAAIVDLCEKIYICVNEYNSMNQGIHLSISTGYSISDKASTDLRELFKQADNYMYREKLHRSQSTRSVIVQTVMKLLEVRDFVTEGHAERMQDLASELAVVAGIRNEGIADIRLLAQFHDIGKVGMPDRILFKPTKLDSDELTEMRRHAEIGQRIALASPEIAPIADWILKHHEWWNGKGYPLGIKEKSIPLACRIIAIVDAYDAMTNDRPYRKAMQKQEAIEELKRGAGAQFDPNLVEKFIVLLN